MLIRCTNINVFHALNKNDAQDEWRKVTLKFENMKKKINKHVNNILQKRHKI